MASTDRRHGGGVTREQPGSGPGLSPYSLRSGGCTPTVITAGLIRQIPGQYAPTEHQRWARVISSYGRRHGDSTLRSRHMANENLRAEVEWLAARWPCPKSATSVGSALDFSSFWRYPRSSDTTSPARISATRIWTGSKAGG